MSDLADTCRDEAIRHAFETLVTNLSSGMTVGDAEERFRTALKTIEQAYRIFQTL